MAEPKTTNASEQSQERGQAMARQQRGSGTPERGGPVSGWLSSPFALMSRISDDMDQMFDRVFRDIGWAPRARPSSGLFGTGPRERRWTPQVEAIQNGDRFVVRADLPGLSKDDVQVDLHEDALTIRGERRTEQKEERDGYYHSEREYGQFYRRIPLPEGTIAESAQATFRNGVLEITMQAPPAEAARGRRLEIADGSETSNPR